MRYANEYDEILYATSRIVFIKRANCAEELLLMIMMMQMSLLLVQLKIIGLTKLSSCMTAGEIREVSVAKPIDDHHHAVDTQRLP